MLIALAVNVLALLALGYAALFLLAAVRALNTRVETPRARQRRTDAFARRLAATLPAHLQAQLPAHLQPGRPWFSPVTARGIFLALLLLGAVLATALAGYWLPQ